MCDRQSEKVCTDPEMQYFCIIVSSGVTKNMFHNIIPIVVFAPQNNTQCLTRGKIIPRRLCFGMLATSNYYLMRQSTLLQENYRLKCSCALSRLRAKPSLKSKCDPNGMS